MEPTQTFSAIVAAAAGAGAIFVIVRMAWSAVSNPITIKRKDSGKSVTLSKHANSDDARRLLELVH